MSDIEQPQLYLITPREFELSSFSDKLQKVLDAAEIACLRLTLATSDEDQILRSADLVREISHARDIPMVIDTHVQMVTRLGLDGVHLPDGSRNIRKWRDELGADAIIGGYCGQSRHDGMNAGEAGADYVCFGPVGQSSLGDGSRAAPELFEWWSQMIEVPVVAEGALTEADIRAVAPFTDFFGLGDEIWRSEDPAAKIKEITKLIAASI